MGQSTNYQFPYPEPSSTVDVARDVKALAQSVDAALFPAGRWLATTDQSVAPPLNQVGVHVDFLAASWPRPTFTGPRSGRVFVTIGAYLINSATTGSTLYCSVRNSTAAAGVVLSNSSLASLAGGGVYASKAFVWSGLTAGTSYTLIPTWYMSSGTAANCTFQWGNLSVYAVQ